MQCGRQLLMTIGFEIKIIGPRIDPMLKKLCMKYISPRVPFIPKSRQKTLQFAIISARHHLSRF